VGSFGKGGYESQVDFHKYDIETKKWVEVESKGTLPFPPRPLMGVVDDRNVVYLYGGYDGKNPLRGLIEYDSKESIWKTAKLWLDLDDDSLLSSAAVGSKGMEPTPRYGHGMIIQDKTITVFGGSGSTYLNDVFQFDLEEN